MALSQVTALFLFLFLATGTWLFSRFFTEIVALILGLLTGNKLSFRAVGFLKFKDIRVRFKKGSVGSLYIGSFKCHFFAWKRQGAWVHIQLQFVDIVLRTQKRSGPKKPSSKGKKSKGSGTGKWQLLKALANLVRVTFLDLSVKHEDAPGASVCIRETSLGRSKKPKGAGRLFVAPGLGINVHVQGLAVAVQGAGSKNTTSPASSLLPTRSIGSARSSTSVPSARVSTADDFEAPGGTEAQTQLSSRRSSRGILSLVLGQEEEDAASPILVVDTWQNTVVLGHDKVKGVHVLEVAVECSSFDISASEHILDAVKAIQKSIKDKKMLLNKEASLTQGPPTPVLPPHQVPPPSGPSPKSPPTFPQKVSVIVAGISLDCQHTTLGLQAQSSVGKIHLAATSSPGQAAASAGQVAAEAPLDPPQVNLNLVVGRVKLWEDAAGALLDLPQIKVKATSSPRQHEGAPFAPHHTHGTSGDPPGQEVKVRVECHEARWAVHTRTLGAWALAAQEHAASSAQSTATAQRQAAANSSGPVPVPVVSAPAAAAAPADKGTPAAEAPLKGQDSGGPSSASASATAAGAAPTKSSKSVLEVDFTLMASSPSLAVFDTDNTQLYKVATNGCNVFLRGPTNALKLLKTVPAPPGTVVDAEIEILDVTVHRTVAPGTPNTASGLFSGAPGSSVPSSAAKGVDVPLGPPASSKAGAVLLRAARLAAELAPGVPNDYDLDFTWISREQEEREKGGKKSKSQSGRQQGQRRRPSKPVQPRQVTTQLGLTSVEVFLDAAALEAVAVQVGRLECFQKELKARGPPKKPKAPKVVPGPVKKKGVSGFPPRFSRLVVNSLRLHFDHTVEVVECEVPDPKRINFGDDIGEKVFHTRPEGGPRTARVEKVEFGGKRVGPAMACRVSLEVPCASVIKDSWAGSTSARLAGLGVKYIESDPAEGRAAAAEPLTTTVLLDLQDVWVVHQTGVPGECTSGSDKGRLVQVDRAVLSAQSLTGHWDPDAHLFLLEASRQAKRAGKRRKEVKAEYVLSGGPSLHQYVAATRSSLGGSALAGIPERRSEGAVGAANLKDKSWSRRASVPEEILQGSLAEHSAAAAAASAAAAGEARRSGSLEDGSSAKEASLAGSVGKSGSDPRAKEGAVEPSSAAASPAPGVAATGAEAAVAGAGAGAGTDAPGAAAAAAAAAGGGGVGAEKAKKKTQVAADIGNLCFRALAGDGIEFKLEAANAFSEDVSGGMLLEDASFRINGAQVLDSPALDIRRVPCAAPVFVAPMEVARQVGELKKGSQASTKAQAQGSHGARGAATASKAPTASGSGATAPGTGATTAGGQASVHVPGWKEPSKVWDYVVHADSTRIIIPLRLEIRAVEDAFEDMMRVLKLVDKAQKEGGRFAAAQGDGPLKVRPLRKGNFRVHARRLTVEVEEEPMQAWLGQHYRIRKELVAEQLIRETLLESRLQDALPLNPGAGASTGPVHPGEAGQVGLERERAEGVNDAQGMEGSVRGGVGLRSERSASTDRGTEEVVVEDPYWKAKPFWFEGAMRSLWEQTASKYRAACAKLEPDYGSGSPYGPQWQRSFVMSKSRRSLMTLKFATLDVALVPVVRGREGMVEFIREMDDVPKEQRVPISRMYGRCVELKCGAMRLGLRDYPLPLFAASSGRIAATFILAAQATIYQPQISTPVYLGRWRKVTVLRSVSGSTPPLKVYAESVMDYEDGEFSYGVGYEPTLFADVSYVVTVAIRKADLSARSKAQGAQAVAVDLSGAASATGGVAGSGAAAGSHSATGGTPLCGPGGAAGGVGAGAAAAAGGVPGVPGTAPPAKERSLPWWDIMRYYMHTRTRITATNFRIDLQASVDPREEEELLRMEGSKLVFTQRKGMMLMHTEDLECLISCARDDPVRPGGLGAASFRLQRGERMVPPIFKSASTGHGTGQEQGQSGAQLGGSGDRGAHSLSLGRERERGGEGSGAEEGFHKRGAFVCHPVIQSPVFDMEMCLEWECASGAPSQHYLHALPHEPCLRVPLYDPFRSVGFNLSWEWRFLGKKDEMQAAGFRGTSRGAKHSARDICQSSTGPKMPTFNLASHDIQWIMRFYSLMYSSSHKLRSFGKRRYGIPRKPRSGNLSLSQTLSEMLVRIYIEPGRWRHYSRRNPDPAKNLILCMDQLTYELCYSRNLRQWNGEGKRPSFRTAYTGFDVSRLSMFIMEEFEEVEAEGGESEGGPGGGQVLDHQEEEALQAVEELLNAHVPGAGGLRLQTAAGPTNGRGHGKNGRRGTGEARVGAYGGRGKRGGGYGVSRVNEDRGFVMACEEVVVRRQSPDANSVQLLGWAVGQRQRRSALLDAVGPTEDKRQLERKAAALRGELNPTEGWGRGQRRRGGAPIEAGGEVLVQGVQQGPGGVEDGSEDEVEDEALTVLKPDNCWRILVPGLRLFWTLKNRDALWAWVAEVQRGCASRKPSPSRLRALERRKALLANSLPADPLTATGAPQAAGGSALGQAGGGAVAAGVGSGLAGVPGEGNVRQADSEGGGGATLATRSTSARSRWWKKAKSGRQSQSQAPSQAQPQTAPAQHSLKSSKQTLPDAEDGPSSAASPLGDTSGYTSADGHGDFSADSLSDASGVRSPAKSAGSSPRIAALGVGPTAVLAPAAGMPTAAGAAGTAAGTGAGASALGAGGRGGGGAGAGGGVPGGTPRATWGRSPEPLGVPRSRTATAAESASLSRTTSATATVSAPETSAGPAVAETLDEEKLNYMISVVHPQFNLHSEEAHGRFLLSAKSGRVFSRTFRSLVQGLFAIPGQERGAAEVDGVVPILGKANENLLWDRHELNVMLEHVQAHVAPTNVDLNAGIQWLPRSFKPWTRAHPRSTPKPTENGSVRSAQAPGQDLSVPRPVRLVASAKLPEPPGAHPKFVRQTQSQPEGRHQGLEKGQGQGRKGGSSMQGRGAHSGTSAGKDHKGGWSLQEHGGVALREGCLLQQVFAPCTMYLRYTQFKSGSEGNQVQVPEQAKPLKEVNFKVPNITASMTSGQFQVLVDVIGHLILAPLPKKKARAASGAAGASSDAAASAGGSAAGGGAAGAAGERGELGQIGEGAGAAEEEEADEELAEAVAEEESKMRDVVREAKGEIEDAHISAELETRRYNALLRDYIALMRLQGFFLDRKHVVELQGGLGVRHLAVLGGGGGGGGGRGGEGATLATGGPLLGGGVTPYLGGSGALGASYAGRTSFGAGDITQVLLGHPTLTLSSDYSDLTLAILGALQRQRLACRSANASILQVVARAAKRAGESGGAKKKATAAMSIRWTIDHAAWSLMHEGSTFAEAGITRLVLAVERDFTDVGEALFSIGTLEVRNCLEDAKSDVVLAAWNPPPDWAKMSMLRVTGKLSAPASDGSSVIQRFQVHIYPLRIHFTEQIFRMVWVYLFPPENDDDLRLNEVWGSQMALAQQQQEKREKAERKKAAAAAASKKHDKLLLTAPEDGNAEDEAARLRRSSAGSSTASGPQRTGSMSIDGAPLALGARASDHTGEVQGYGQGQARGSGAGSGLVRMGSATGYDGAGEGGVLVELRKAESEGFGAPGLSTEALQELQMPRTLTGPMPGGENQQGRVALKPGLPPLHPPPRVLSQAGTQPPGGHHHNHQYSPQHSHDPHQSEEGGHEDQGLKNQQAQGALASQGARLQRKMSEDREAIIVQASAVGADETGAEGGAGPGGPRGGVGLPPAVQTGVAGVPGKVSEEDMKRAGTLRKAERERERREQEERRRAKREEKAEARRKEREELESKRKEKMEKAAQLKREKREQEERRLKRHQQLRIQNIDISQFELLATYEGSLFRQAKQVRLLIDPFILPDYEGTWRKLFSKIKRHVILGVTKSLTGLQRHKFTHRDLATKVGSMQGSLSTGGGSVPGSRAESVAEGDSDEEEGSVMSLDDAWAGGDLDLSLPGPASRIIQTLRRRADRNGDGFVSNMTDLFKSQLGKAKTVLARVGEGGEMGSGREDGEGGFMGTGGGGVIAGGIAIAGGSISSGISTISSGGSVLLAKGQSLVRRLGPTSWQGNQEGAIAEETEDDLDMQMEDALGYLEETTSSEDELEKPARP